MATNDVKALIDAALAERGFEKPLKAKELVAQAMKDQEATVDAVNDPLRYEQGKLVRAKTPSQIVSETAQLVVRASKPFDGDGMVDSLAKEVLAQRRSNEVMESARAVPSQAAPSDTFADVTKDIQPMSTEDVKVLITHQESHNMSEPIAGCKFCEQEQAINKGEI
jgi:hypothetical protein